MCTGKLMARTSFLNRVRIYSFKLQNVVQFRYKGRCQVEMENDRSRRGVMRERGSGLAALRATQDGHGFMRSANIEIGKGQDDH